VRTLLSFKDSDVKFDVAALMDVLRDKRHEGWVLAAYPDPKTAQPLIGAGFSLDLPAREHPQRDPENPRPFLEPSSAELWQAAGLAPEKLQTILAEFSGRMATWDKGEFRRQIRSLEPQITDDDANALLRIGIVQSIDNAKAYCRNFNRLRASQQMAMTQLVYQMGINLEEFSTFLGLMNRDNMTETAAMAKADQAYWREVQLSLVQSQWARLYRDRAKAVIAMLDPRYEANPAGAERSIGAVLRPVHVRRGHGAHLRSATYTRHRNAASRRHAARARKD
jgi:GH24 family phage-related lysozyme (muramidase)